MSERNNVARPVMATAIVLQTATGYDVVLNLSSFGAEIDAQDMAEDLLATLAYIEIDGHQDTLH
jgi:hypothetical protein